MIKKEQFNALRPYEQHFITAKGDYVRGLYSKDVEVLYPVYESLGYHLTNKHCGSCLIGMCKVLGEEYFKYKERYYDRKKQKE